MDLGFAHGFIPGSERRTTRQLTAASARPISSVEILSSCRGQLPTALGLSVAPSS